MESEEKLSALSIAVADHVSAMLAYWDKDLICRFANDAYMDWFGRKREEMVDRITIIELLGPLYELNKPYIDGALAGNKQTFERAIPLPLGKGVRYSLANYFPDIVNGEVNGFFVHVADITENKLLEHQLHASNSLVIEQNKRLLNFANVVSHNLKSYAGNLSSIMELLVNPDFAEVKEDGIDFLKTFSKKFTSTIDHLTEIVKVQNNQEVKRETIALSQYVENIVSTLGLQLHKENAVILNHIAPSIVLYSNPAYVESILLNLLTNAMKYKHSDRNPIIDIECILESNDLILMVRDNGLGIDLQKYGDRMFGMYQTFHHHPDTNGIGLFIAKYQIEQLGGHIEVESVVNEGSVFKVFLPLDKGE
jgi:PAS domain S-box-containing protein